MTVTERTVDEQAEAALLDALLLRPEQVAEVRAVVLPEDFYRPRHQWVFKAILAVADAGEPVDYVTVHHELRREGVHQDGTDVADLFALRCPSSSRGLTYARIVAERARCRRWLVALREAHQQTLDGRDLDEVRKWLMDVAT